MKKIKSHKFKIFDGDSIINCHIIPPQFLYKKIHLLNNKILRYNKTKAEGKYFLDHLPEKKVKNIFRGVLNLLKEFNYKHEGSEHALFITYDYLDNNASGRFYVDKNIIAIDIDLLLNSRREIFPVLAHEICHFYMKEHFSSDHILLRKQDMYSYLSEGTAYFTDQLLYPPDHDPMFNHIIDLTTESHNLHFGQFACNYLFKYSMPSLRKLFSKYYLSDKKIFGKFNKHLRDISVYEATILNDLRVKNADLVIIPAKKITKAGYSFIYNKKSWKQPLISAIGETEIYIAKYFGVPVFECNEYNTFQKTGGSNPFRSIPISQIKIAANLYSKINRKIN